MGDATFHSLTECEVWITTHVAPANFYSFYDCVSIVDQMKNHEDHEKRPDAEYKASKMKMT
jgi:hypothetical protein